MRGSRPFDGVDPNWFSAAQHALIEKLLRVSVVLVACHPDHPDQVFGYLVGDPEERYLHWLYVRHDFRRCGIASQLLAQAYGDAPITVTCNVTGTSYLRRHRRVRVRSHPLCRLTRQG